MFFPKNNGNLLKKVLYIFLVYLCAANSQAQDVSAHMRDNLFLYYGENAEEKIKKNLLCTALASKNEVYTGEPLVVTYKLCSGLQSYSVVEKMPPFNGFSVYEIKENEPAKPEAIAGNYYNCYPIRKVQLYPGEAGTFTLEAATIKNTVTFQQTTAAEKGRGLLPEGYTPTDDHIPGLTKTEHEYRCLSGQPVIKVLPLPEAGKPNGFSGAVGRFALSVTSNGSATEKNGTLKLTYTLSGAGNFKMINELPVTPPPGFELFDPVIREEIDERQVPFSGKKIFEYTFSPTVEGPAEMNDVRFSFFNPATRSYYSLTAKGMPVQVEPEQTAPPPVQNEEPARAATGSGNNLLWYAIPGAVVIIALVLYRFTPKKEKQEITGEPAGEEEDIFSQKAPYFEYSRNLDAAGNTEQFFTVLNRELHEAVTETAALPNNTSTSDVYNWLLQHKPGIAPAYRQLTQQLGAIIYAYGTPEMEPAVYLHEAEQLVAAIKG